jgi:hypothetical protein
MSKIQLHAAGILLRKTLTDMIAQTVERKPVESMADDELLETLKSIRGYIATQSAGEGSRETGEGEPALPLSSLQ